MHVKLLENTHLTSPSVLNRVCIVMFAKKCNLCRRGCCSAKVVAIFANEISDEY